MIQNSKPDNRDERELILARKMQHNKDAMEALRLQQIELDAHMALLWVGRRSLLITVGVGKHRQGTDPGHTVRMVLGVKRAGKGGAIGKVETKDKGGQNKGSGWLLRTMSGINTCHASPDKRIPIQLRKSRTPRRTIG